MPEIGVVVVVEFVDRDRGKVNGAVYACVVLARETRCLTPSAMHIIFRAFVKDRYQAQMPTANPDLLLSFYHAV
ncbi:hypothetical protein CVT25_008062 [Psilocybe cyanescens]|uniref:Uncharacterized protein n=1 Tax=Psilocybe cyanescens TaxID=93625 RepID=A0A409WUK1_PSICY|nr:hypothetical protein CVT25_008062 [Psilocybe cyanescens]